MKNSGVLAIAALASLIIWLMSNLSQTSTAVVTINVAAQSSLVGHSRKASEVEPVVAAVSATGFRLIELQSKKKPVTVTFAPEHIEGMMDGEFFTVPASTLYLYASDMFGSGVTVQSFVSQKMSLRFPKEDFRKIPVSAMTAVTYKPQYMPISEIALSPDSVLVYADPVRLEELDVILTKPIKQRELSRDAHGIVRLDFPVGFRVEPTEVTYAIDVSRFVETRKIVEIGVRNVPDECVLSVFPGTCEISAKLVFPVSGNPLEGVEFYVDYDDFVLSKGGKCPVMASSSSNQIIEWKASPEFVECVETML